MGVTIYGPNPAKIAEQGMTQDLARLCMVIVRFVRSQLGGHTSTDSLGHLRTCAEIIIFHANKTYAFEYAFVLSSSLQRCVVAPYPSSSAATRAERSHLLGVVTCVCMPSLITLVQFSTAPCIPVHNISRRNKKIVINPWLPNKLILSTLFVKLSISFTLILTCQLRL